jgi:hypothetical protein
MNANIETQLNAMLANRNAINEAINLRAGETLINADAGLTDAPSAILSIPTDSNTLYYKTDDTSAYQKLVPRGAQPMTQLISVGGITRIETGANLLIEATDSGISTDVGVNQYENFYLTKRLPAGTYRYYQRLEYAEDVVDVGGRAMVNENGDEFAGSFQYLEPQELLKITEPRYIQFYLYASTGGSDTRQTTATVDVTHGEYGETTTDTQTIPIGEEYSVSIPSNSTLARVTITTNTRTKITVSPWFEDVHENEIFVTQGTHTFYWGAPNNMRDYTIKIEQADSIPVKVFPMLYAVPEDNQDFTLNKYKAYWSNLVPTPVSEIVSEGKNILSSDVYNASKWKPSPTSSDWHNYPLNLSDGWYCITTKVKDNYSGNVYFYLQKSTDGGLTYTSKEAGYNGRGTTTTGYLITSYGAEQPEVWFKVDNNAGIVYKLTCHTISQSKLDEIAYVQIERVNLTQEPSNKYPPGVYAPATEYKPYVGTLDTVAIPDAVKNDASWGCGATGKYVVPGSYVTTNASNTYDFSEKTYTKKLTDIIELDGESPGLRFSAQSTSNNQLHFSASMSSLEEKYGKFLKEQHTIMAISRPFTPTNPWALGEWKCWMSHSTLFCRFPETIDSYTAANEWLKARKTAGYPVKLQIALETEVVTTITDESYTPPKLIRTEAGGTITFENEAKEAVPSSVKYLIDLGEIV